MNLLCELLSEFKKSIVPFQLPGALDTLRFWKLYVGEGGLLWNCELMYFYIPLYFTEKLLPFLVPRVSIFYATPTPRLSLSWEVKGMQIDSNWNEGPPAPLVGS